MLSTILNCVAPKYFKKTLFVWLHDGESRKYRTLEAHFIFFFSLHTLDRLLHLLKAE